MERDRSEVAYHNMVGDRQPRRRAMFIDNSRRIQQDLEQVIAKMEQRCVAPGKQIISWKWGWKTGLVCAPFALSVVLALVIINWQGASWTKISGAGVCLVLGIVMSWFVGLWYHRELLAERKNYEGFVEKLMHKTVWRASPGWHLPGMDNSRAMKLRELALRCEPQEVENAFERLFHLRMQYDQDMNAAKLEVSGEQDFIHTHWLDNPREMDALGMDSLCRAISELDMGKVVKLLGEGKRLDLQIRPYKKNYFNCPLSLAFNPKEAVADLAGQKSLTLDKAKEELLEKRMEMFAFLLEQNPRIWIHTIYAGSPLGLHCCFGNERFEAIFRAFEKKTRLMKLANADKDNCAKLPKM